MKTSIGVFAVAGLAMTGCSDSTVVLEERTVDIAAIIDFSGDNGSDGHLRLAAIQAAIEDANEELRDQGVTVELTYGDAQTSPTAAQVLLNTFLLQGVRVVVGPFTSEEALGVKGLIDASTSLIVSPSSTSLELAGPPDHIFRLAPNDERLVEALVDRMVAEGRTKLGVLYRQDSWGRSVSGELRRRFELLGGEVVTSYGLAALRTNLIEQLLTDIESDLAPHVAADPEAVAVELVSFQEGALVFDIARERVPSLGRLAWYGSDGFVNDPTVVENPDLGSFAVSTGYVAPIYSVSPAATFEGLAARIEEAAGRAPSAYDYLAYDATRVAALALSRIPADADYEQLQAAFFSALEEYDGVSGRIVLDDVTGDRVGGEYDFYRVHESGGSYDWIRDES